MTARDRRPRFRAAVYRGRPGLHAATKVLLLRLSDSMNSRGVVSVPRSRLADELGVPPARITEAIQNARECGYLDIVRRARPKVTAVYQALIPTVSEVRPPVPRRGTDSVPLRGGSEVRIYPSQEGNGGSDPKRSPSPAHPDERRSDENGTDPGEAAARVTDRVPGRRGVSG